MGTTPASAAFSVSFVLDSWHREVADFSRSSRPWCEGAGHAQGVIVLAGIGFLTSLLELLATSIGAGIVVGTFGVSATGMLSGRTRREIEANALRDIFWGSMAGMLCLSCDLLVRAI